MKKETIEKLYKVRALKGKTINDIISMPKYRHNLSHYMTEQSEARKAALASYAAIKKAGGGKGLKVPAHPVDIILKMTVEEFCDEYRAVLAKKSSRPASERKYIEQLGKQAYMLTVAEIACKQFPELKDEFFPESNTN